MIDDRDPIAAFGLVHVARHQNDRRTGVGAQLVEIVSGMFTRLRIESDARLLSRV